MKLPVFHRIAVFLYVGLSFLIVPFHASGFPIINSYSVGGRQIFAGSLSLITDEASRAYVKNFDVAMSAALPDQEVDERSNNPLEFYRFTQSGKASLGALYFYTASEFTSVQEMARLESSLQSYVATRFTSSMLDIPFKVNGESNDSTLIIIVNGERGKFQTIIEGPLGVVGPDTIIFSDFNTVFIFSAPSIGDWNLRVETFEPVFIRILTNGPQLTPLTKLNELFPASKNILLKIEGATAPPTHIHCEIHKIVSLSNFDSIFIGDISLFDDGVHSDSDVSDNIWGNMAVLEDGGVYFLKYIVEDEFSHREIYQVVINNFLPPVLGFVEPSGIVADRRPIIDFTTYSFDPHENTPQNIFVALDGAQIIPELEELHLGQLTKITGRFKIQTDLSLGRHTIHITHGNSGFAYGEGREFIVFDSSIPSPLLINEISIEDKWVEILATNGHVDLSNGFFISGLNNSTRYIAGSRSTRSLEPITLQKGEFAVIHYEEGESDRDGIDNNGNGIKDLFVGRMPLKSTDDQIALLSFMQNPDIPFVPPRFLKDNPMFVALDAVAYSNNDGEINGRIDNEVFFSEELVRVGQWKMEADRFTQDDAVSLPKTAFSSVGRKVGSTDNNGKDDWEEFVVPTLGGPNIKLNPAKKGDILITEFSVEDNKLDDWVEFEVKNGPVDLRGVVITTLEDNSFFRLARVDGPEILVNPGQRILVHFVPGENETLENDINGNGALDIHFGPYNLPANDNQIVLMFGSEILDAVQYVKKDGRLTRDKKDIARIVNFGAWQISGPSYTEDDGVELPGPLYSLGRKSGEPDTDREEDWFVMLRPSPGRENVIKDVPPEGTILINEVRMNNVFGKEEDWAELYNPTDEAQEIDFYVLSDLNGENRKLAPDVLTIGAQSFAVVRWVTPFDDRQTEIDAMGDVNGNGYRDIYLIGGKLAGNALSGTDNQLVLSAGKRILDAVSWSNGDGLMTEREWRDNQFLVTNGAWMGTFADRSDQSSAVILQSQFFPIARLPNGFDSNKNTDWNVAEPTPGASNKDFTEDRIPPVTTLVIHPPSAFVEDSRYVSLSHRFHLIPRDDFTSFIEVFYNLPEFGDQFVSIFGPFFLSREGENRIRYFAVDAAGNKEEPREAFVTVDAIHPISRSELTNNRLRIIAADTGGSGVESVNLSVDSGEFLRVYPDTVVVFDQPDTHVIVFFSKDRVGNEEPVHTETIFVRIVADDEPPFFVRFLPSGGETFIAKRDTITISLEAKDNFDPFPSIFSQLAHFVGTTSDTAITVVDSRQIAPLSIPAGQWKLLATAKDAAGNIRTQEGGFFTVIHDALPPRTALTVGDPKFVRSSDSAAYITAATPLTFAAVDDLVTVGDAGGLGVAKIEVSVNGGVFAAVSGPLTLTGLGEGKHTVSYRATDVVGNVEATQTAVLYIDATAPVTTDSKTPAANKNGWNAADVSVSLSAADPVLLDNSNGGSGVKETRLGVDGATPTTSTSATAVSAEGVHTLAFFSVDNIGNTEAIRSDTVRIDKTAPAVVSNRSPQANNNGWNRDPVFVSYTATDALSGVDTSTSDLATDVLSVGAAGQSASAVAVDLAGNTTTVTVTNINIDSTPPIITTTRSPSPNLNGWHNTSVTVAFSETDSLSGIDTSASDVTLLSEGFSQSALGFAVDLAGNTTSATISGIHIDLTNPVITADALPPANINGWRNTAVTVTFTETDALSGIDTPAQDVVVSIEGAGQSAFGFAVDLAGNTATASVSGINIDFTAPALSVQSITPDSTGLGLDGRSWWKSPVTVAFSATDTLSGLDVGRTALNFTLPDEGKDQGVTGIAVDEADNTSSLAVTGINIDFTAPQTTLAIGEPQVVDGQTFVTSATPFTLTAVDTLSGVAQTEFRLEEGGEFAPGMSFTLQAPEGGRSVGFRSTDVAGNIESEKTTEVVLDNTAPATTLAVDITDTTGTVLIPQSEITLTSVDGPALTPAVGVDRIEYQIDGGAAQVYSGAFSVSDLGSHTLTYKAFDRLGNPETTHTFNFRVSPALAASKFLSFAPRVLVWLNDESGKEDDDDEDEKDKGIPDANMAVLTSILDSAPILLYDLVDNPDSFIVSMRTDSYNVYLIIGDEEDLDKKQEWELSERVRMGDGLISSFLDEIDLSVHDKGEHEGKDKDDDEGDDKDKGKSGDDHGKGKDKDHGKDDDEHGGDDDGDKGKEDDHDKDSKAEKNLLGVDVDGKHSDKNIKISLMGAAIPFTGEYQTTDKTKRVRAMASTAVGDGFVTPNGKDKESEATVVSNAFGVGKTVFLAFNLGQSATPTNATQTEQLVRAALEIVRPVKEIFIPASRVAIGIAVQSLVVPLNLAVRVEESIPADASIVNKLSGDLQAGSVVWNLTLDVNESDTIHYVLGLPDMGEASVTTEAEIRYQVRGVNVLFDTLPLTIVTEKALPALLDQAVGQLNALSLTDHSDKKTVEDAVEELQEQRTTSPSTREQIEDAVEEILEIVRDLDGVAADTRKLSDIRDTLDKVVMVYERKLSE